MPLGPILTLLSSAGRRCYDRIVDETVDQATLIVSRNSARDLKFRGIEVLLDGEYITNLKFSDRFEMPIEPGTHVIESTNRMSTRSIEFEAQPGQIIEFETIGIAMGGIWMLVSMLGTIAYRVELKQVPVN